LEATPEYLVIGHVTQDLAPDGTSRAGGTATYSALAAERLGLRVGVVTSASDETPLFQHASMISVRRRSAAQTTTFENVYLNGSRRQYIRAVAERLSDADLPPGWTRAPIVHLGPVAQEVDPALVGSFPGALLGVTPQGWLRRWDARGLVSPVALRDAERILPAVGVMVLSREDVAGDRQMLEYLLSLVRLAVLTVGREGAIVYHEGRQQCVPAYVVQEVDPTGAGDVFATAYLIRLHETGDAIEAARYANSAASFAVEGIGTATVPSREQVERRLRHGHLRA